mgnify:CR=1 FL=1
MKIYDIYEAGEKTGGTLALAFEPRSPLSDGLRYIGSVEGEPYRGYAPGASAFQSSQENEYIATLLPWPYHCAVIVH